MFEEPISGVLAESVERVLIAKGVGAQVRG